MELAQAALQDKNCIIVAPTGSGKTHVALKIIQVFILQCLLTVLSSMYVDFKPVGKLISISLIANFRIIVKNEGV